MFATLVAIAILVAVMLPAPACAPAARINFTGSEWCEDSVRLDGPFWGYITEN